VRLLQVASLEWRPLEYSDWTSDFQSYRDSCLACSAIAGIIPLLGIPRVIRALILKDASSHLLNENAIGTPNVLCEGVRTSTSVRSRGGDIPEPSAEKLEGGSWAVRRGGRIFS
jgi:hypothetical protein